MGRRRRRRQAREQIVRRLREAGRLLEEGVGAPGVAKQLEVSGLALYRWRQQYGGLEAAGGKRLKELVARERGAQADGR